MEDESEWRRETDRQTESGTCKNESPIKSGNSPGLEKAS